jgi:hypothetical protein
VEDISAGVSKAEHNEAIVDAYGPEEQAESKIHFPFNAKCIASKATSPLRKGEIIQVRRLAPEDEGVEIATHAV